MIRRGFSLVEVLVSSVLVGAAMVSAVYAATSAARSARIAEEWRDASILIEGIAAEIFALPYSDPEGGTGIGPDAGESRRSAFDDVNDYDGLIETSPEDWQGNAVGVPDGWGRRVAVEYTTVENGDVSRSSSDTGLVRVIIKLISPSGAEFSSWFERARGGAGDAQHAEERTVARTVAISAGGTTGTSKNFRSATMTGLPEAQP